MLKKLWNLTSSQRHRQFFLLFFLMILASLVEVVSIGAILPFLGVLTDPNLVYHHPLMSQIIEVLNISNPEELLLPVTIFFVIAVIFAGIIRISLLYVMTKFSFLTGVDLSVSIYRRTLYQSYSVHVMRNSSEVINGIITKTNSVIGGVITPFLHIISSAMMIVAIIFTLYTVDPEVAISALVGFGVIYLVVILFTKGRLKRNSVEIATQSTKMIKALQEGLGGIRDVLIDGTQEFYCKIYQKADFKYRKSSSSNSIINASPRYFIEAIGVSLIAILAYGMSLREGGLSTAIPILGALALGAQRLLPALQQLYGSYSTIKGVRASFEDVLELLEQPLPIYNNLNNSNEVLFDKKIALRNLNFRYTHDGPWILMNVNLDFIKGSKIGFIGETGCGKSTLIDIIMGLLPPTSGELIIDHQAIDIQNCSLWQRRIAHVPQSIYLSDNTIEENIAFGMPKNKINHQRVRKAAQLAQISELIESWKDGYNTFVGERGIRLSGGQRQRIGIARAFYKKVDVLIFDEATSSLDSKTEAKIMNAIKGLDSKITVLIIAHRLTTLKDCDQVVKISKDHKITIESYKDVIEASSDNF
jgi:ATP-binding cassette, subfamily B, bacterial PglK